jgi:hypothetical protein
MNAVQEFARQGRAARPLTAWRAPHILAFPAVPVERKASR